jgi:hypothetical protein
LTSVIDGFRSFDDVCGELLPMLSDRSGLNAARSSAANVDAKSFPVGDERAGLPRAQRQAVGRRA